MGLFGNDAELEAKITQIEQTISTIEERIAQLNVDVESSYSDIKNDIQNRHQLHTHAMADLRD